MGFNATAFQEFYETTLGQMTARFVRAQVNALWPDVKGLRLLGMGYPHPYFSEYRQQAECCMIMLPPSTERIPWPEDETQNTLSIGHPGTAPYRNEMFDRIMISHCLEFSGHVSETLAEARRMLKPGGRMLLIVPNRLSSWARQETTPFGFGTPFTHGQINRYVKEAGFSIEQTRRALYAPPFETAFCQNLAPAFEEIGQVAFRGFGGVYLLELIKSEPAPIKPQKGTPAPVTKPIIKPATPGGQAA